ncbi:unnamed protein product [Acanthoscelides obtectus]|uniref:Cytochrome b-c1 complex subunit 8 n=1 Tax=Acanthoscelides obtectus TaxID=200917 RepID=A0A9P0P5F7_ACAOB|nr:unnamed protein product [Acanthoscelides obtectus]CAK1632374.1 hypothetical protein AOBTE_LOCUS7514 [Acanthoscelides obtectus]
MVKYVPYIMRRIVTYSISPHHLKIFPNIPHATWRTYRRCKEEFLYVVPPLAIGAAVYKLATARHKHLLRKKPDEFDDEE